MPLAHTIGTLTQANNPIEYIRFEELAGNFLKTSPGGYDFTAGTSELIPNRGVSAICKGIECDTPLSTCVSNLRIAESQRPRTPTFRSDLGGYAFCQWVKPIGSLTRPTLVTAHHPSDPAIYGPSYGSPDPEIVAVGCGLIVDSDYIESFLHAGSFINGPFPGYWGVHSTRYEGSALLVNQWNQIVVVVTSGKVIKFFLNGIHCGSHPGTYREYTSVHERVGSFPYYGRRDLVSTEACDLLGNAWDGFLDEASWYNYVPADSYWLQNYYAGLATLNATAVGALGVLDSEYRIGDAIPLSWGAAVGATAYLIEIERSGVWSELSIVVGTSTSYLVTDAEGVTLRFRITPLFTAGQYAPETSCLNVQTTSSIITVLPATTPCILIEPTITDEESELLVLTSEVICGSSMVTLTDEESTGPTLVNCP